MGVLFTAKTESDKLTSFGRVIAKIIQLLNKYRTEHVMDPSQVVPYTLEDLANDIECSCGTMSRCCNRDPITGRPKQYPTRHMIVKIIVVAALTPDLATELLSSVGYAINPVYERDEYVTIYKQLIEHPRPIPKNTHAAIELVEEINGLLLEAVEKGAPYRGSPTIRSVFVITDN